jgi:hypothetical protein
MRFSIGKITTISGIIFGIATTVQAAQQKKAPLPKSSKPTLSHTIPSGHTTTTTKDLRPAAASSTSYGPSAPPVATAPSYPFSSSTLPASSKPTARALLFEPTTPPKQVKPATTGLPSSTLTATPPSALSSPAQSTFSSPSCTQTPRSTTSSERLTAEDVLTIMESKYNEQETRHEEARQCLQTQLREQEARHQEELQSLQQQLKIVTKKMQAQDVIHQAELGKVQTELFKQMAMSKELIESAKESRRLKEATVRELTSIANAKQGFIDVTKTVGDFVQKYNATQSALDQIRQDTTSELAKLKAEITKIQAEQELQQLKTELKATQTTLRTLIGLIGTTDQQKLPAEMQIHLGQMPESIISSKFE